MCAMCKIKWVNEKAWLCLTSVHTTEFFRFTIKTNRIKSHIGRLDCGCYCFCWCVLKRSMPWCAHCNGSNNGSSKTVYQHNSSRSHFYECGMCFVSSSLSLSLNMSFLFCLSSCMHLRFYCFPLCHTYISSKRNRFLFYLRFAYLYLQCTKRLYNVLYVWWKTTATTNRPLKEENSQQRQQHYVTHTQARTKWIKNVKSHAKRRNVLFGA